MPRQKTNRKGLTQDEVAAIISENVAVERSFNQAKNARQEKRDEFALAGADLKTLDKWTKRVLKDVPGQEVREEHERDLIYGAASGYELEKPRDLFEGVPDAARTQLTWRERGRRAAQAKEGAYGTPPEGCVGVDAQEYLKGVQEQTEINARGFKTLGERPADAANDGGTRVQGGDQTDLEEKVEQAIEDAQDDGQPDSFEASEEELAGQIQRQAITESRDTDEGPKAQSEVAAERSPDPAEVAAQAEALKESPTFTRPKFVRDRKTAAVH